MSRKLFLAAAAIAACLSPSTAFAIDVPTALPAVAAHTGRADEREDRLHVEAAHRQPASRDHLHRPDVRLRDRARRRRRQRATGTSASSTPRPAASCRARRASARTRSRRAGSAPASSSRSRAAARAATPRPSSCRSASSTRCPRPSRSPSVDSRRLPEPGDPRLVRRERLRRDAQPAPQLRRRDRPERGQARPAEAGRDPVHDADRGPRTRRSVEARAADAALHGERRRDAARRCRPAAHGYRTLDDYPTELKQIVDQYPAIARPVVIGHTFQGREMQGVELSNNVDAKDDGKPDLLPVGTAPRARVAVGRDRDGVRLDARQGLRQRRADHRAC